MTNYNGNRAASWTNHEAQEISVCGETHQFQQSQAERHREEKTSPQAWVIQSPEVQLQILSHI